MSKSQFWRLPTVLQETGLSRSGLYELMTAGEFPKSFSLTERCVAWVSSEVEEWKRAKLKAAGKVREAA